MSAEPVEVIPAEHEERSARAVRALDPRTMPVALLELDLDGVVRAAAGALLTMPPSELVGRSLWDLVEDPANAAELRRALAGESVMGVARWGGRLWQLNYSPLLEDGVLTGVAAGYVDITEHRQAHGIVGSPTLEAILQAAAEAILVIGPDGTVTWANPGCTPLFGRPLHPGMALSELVDAPMAASLLERRAGRPLGQTDRYELQLRNEDGLPLWLLVSASTIQDENGRSLGSVAVLTDITATKTEQARLEAVALSDPLTGIGNRVALSDRLRHALARRDAGVLGVLFFDVDRLKAINDELGHDAGDALLCEVARRAAAVLRPEDTLARYGGDEFVVLCEDLDDPEEGLRLAERIAVAVSVPMMIAGRQILPSVSIGVATTPPIRTADGLVASADRAAYDAKRAGRGQVRIARS